MLFSMLSFTLSHMNISECISYMWTTLNPSHCLNASPTEPWLSPSLPWLCTVFMLSKEIQAQEPVGYQPAHSLPACFCEERNSCAFPACHNSAPASGSGGWMEGWVNENKVAAGICCDVWLAISLGIWSLNFTPSGIRPNRIQHTIGRLLWKHIRVSLVIVLHKCCGVTI